MSLISYNFALRRSIALFIEVEGPAFVLMTLLVLDQQFRIQVWACVGGGGEKGDRGEVKNKMRWR